MLAVFTIVAITVVFRLSLESHWHILRQMPWSLEPQFPNLKILDNNAYLTKLWVGIKWDVVDSTGTQQMGPSGVLGTKVEISYLFLNAPCSAMPLNITSCSSFSLECSSPSTLHPPTIYQGNMGSRVQTQIFHQQSSQTVPLAIHLSTPVREN